MGDRPGGFGTLHQLMNDRTSHGFGHPGESSQTDWSDLSQQATQQVVVAYDLAKTFWFVVLTGPPPRVFNGTFDYLARRGSRAPDAGEEVAIDGGGLKNQWAVRTRLGAADRACLVSACYRARTGPVDSDGQSLLAKARAAIGREKTRGGDWGHRRRLVDTDSRRGHQKR